MLYNVPYHAVGREYYFHALLDNNSLRIISPYTILAHQFIIHSSGIEKIP